MNMQAMLKQAQNMQKDMMKEKDKIDKMEFTGESSLVKVVVTGDKKIKSVDIDTSNLEVDDVDMLSDMFVVATNAALDKVDEQLNKSFSKYGNIPGLF